MELNDANAYIEFLQVPPVPPEILKPPTGNEEEDPEEIEGVSELDSEHEGLDTRLLRTYFEQTSVTIV